MTRGPDLDTMTWEHSHWEMGSEKHSIAWRSVRNIDTEKASGLTLMKSIILLDTRSSSDHGP